MCVVCIRGIVLIIGLRRLINLKVLENADSLFNKVRNMCVYVCVHHSVYIVSLPLKIIKFSRNTSYTFHNITRDTYFYRIYFTFLYEQIKIIIIQTYYS